MPKYEWFSNEGGMMGPNQILTVDGVQTAITVYCQGEDEGLMDKIVELLNLDDLEPFNDPDEDNRHGN